MPTVPTNLPEYVIADIPRQVGTALAEDVGSGDITSLLINENSRSRGTVITREDAVICGTPWVDEVFNQLPGELTVEWQVRDGERVSAGSALCHFEGDSRKILTGERTALNFLQMLSATATRAREFADVARRSGNIHILDTRKTIPGLRTAQKYAVLCGGCENHRLGLFDQFLIKENHIAACGSIKKAILRARELAPEKPIIVEVESLTELAEAIEARPDRIMLDDFDSESLSKGLSMAQGQIAIEISGNVDLDNLGRIAAGFPVCVSVGALTKNIRAIDLSLRLESTSDR